VSASLVSQVEHGRVMPSVATLFRITSELGLGLDGLFAEDAARPAPGRPAATAPAHGSVQRRDARKVIRLAEGVRWERLTPAADPAVEFMYVVYDVGGASCGEDELLRHAGKEYAYLISGKLGVQVGFDAYEMDAGDSLSFDASRPHRLWNLGHTPAVAIWAVVAPRRDGLPRRAAAPARTPPALRSGPHASRGQT